MDPTHLDDTFFFIFNFKGPFSFFIKRFFKKCKILILSFEERHLSILSTECMTGKFLRTLFHKRIKDQVLDFGIVWTNPNPQIDQGLYIYTHGLFVG
jgi:hypothetical protein